VRNFERMTRRFGRSGATCLWLGIVTTLLGGLGACGDDDGEDVPNGTGGASTGGKASASGGAAGMGGSRVSGGSSGAAARAGSGGSSGALTGGAGGIAANAGEGGIPGEGGAGLVAGSPGGGSGGDAGSSTTAGSPNAGSPSAGESGAGGAAGLSVEYRGCEAGAAITRIGLYRIDREQQTCTLVVVQQGQINCLEGLQSEDWCVTGAAISSDIEACEAFLMPSDPVQATAGEGTFTVSTQPLTLDIDIDFEFPVSSGFPESMSIEAEGCLADCAMNDCRP
jgi:hypothetical protein